MQCSKELMPKILFKLGCEIGCESSALAASLLIVASMLSSSATFSVFSQFFHGQSSLEKFLFVQRILIVMESTEKLKLNINAYDWRLARWMA